MQAIELETDINEDGSIRLPEYYKLWFGKHARLIVLSAEQPPLGSTGFQPANGRRMPQKRESLKTVLETTWGAWGHKTADEIDREIAARRNADWERDDPA
ncbi:MAG: hypothetical protein GY862_31635 [Gammaproteobacteria bacterium]|nr:hypothetical protein [Gammaproteobacteria bacterium]